MFLYHCTSNENLCKIPLDDFTKDNIIRGLCFSNAALDHFGEVTYRIELKDEWNMLTTDMLHNLDVSPTNTVDYMSDRHGNPLVIRMDDVRSAFEKACLEFDYDKAQWENLWTCAIAFDDCSGNDELIEYVGGDEGQLGWDLQSIRGRTAYHLGLAGAEISDENGTSYIISDSSLRLDRVEYDDENMEDGWRVVEKCSHTKGADALSQKEFQTKKVEIPPSFKECVESQRSLGPASAMRATISRRL